MKKRIMLPLFAGFAIALAVATSAFTPAKKDPTSLRFHYVSSSYSETAYEDDGNWQEITSTEPECSPGSNPCIIQIQADELSGSGTNEERLERYLKNQVMGTGSDFDNAVDAVDALQTDGKS